MKELVWGVDKRCYTCQFGKPYQDFDIELRDCQFIKDEAYHECGATLHDPNWFCPNWLMKQREVE